LYREADRMKLNVWMSPSTWASQRRLRRLGVAAQARDARSRSKFSTMSL
jgi:hypothetical protein